MPKVIHNPISTVVTKVDGVTKVRADYCLAFTEYPDEAPVRKSAEITLLPATLNDIDEETMAGINAAEGIEPE